MKRAARSVVVSACCALATIAADVVVAQSGGGYSVRRHTEDAGGGRMSGANGFVLQGTIGQPDATPVAMTGAQGYAVRGGFWVAAAPAAPPGDLLFADGFE